MTTEQYIYNVDSLFQQFGLKDKVADLIIDSEKHCWFLTPGSSVYMYDAETKSIEQVCRNERQDTTKSFVTRAVEYVKEHYADQELSIETICSYLNVSAAYFSTVFKKETGKTFINYLTDYRMEQAVDLLLTKDEKTYIIAEKVGYSDPNYFSYVFKKQFGMSPSKYKAGKLGEK